LHWTYNKNLGNRVAIHQESSVLNHTKETFQALVDAIIPRTPALAETFGEIMLYGALDYLTDEFLLMSLNDYYFPLAEPTAELLDVVAEWLILSQENSKLQYYTRYPGGRTFMSLSPDNRFLVLTLLDEYDNYSNELPAIFKEHPEFIQYIMSVLNRLTTLGYYSEWYGYGSTRLLPPDQRVFEFSPQSWEQVGYPGPSLSYRSQVIEYYKVRSVYE
jgi:hypothetical protein